MPQQDLGRSQVDHREEVLRPSFPAADYSFVDPSAPLEAPRTVADGFWPFVARNPWSGPCTSALGPPRLCPGEVRCERPGKSWLSTITSPACAGWASCSSTPTTSC